VYPRNTVCVYEQTNEVMTVFRAHCEQVGAVLNVVQQEDLYQRFSPEGLDGLPLFQRRNWLLARQACENVAKKYDWLLDEMSIKESLHVQIPGRMEVIQIDGKTIVLDGAHNEQKMRSFIDSFVQQFPDQKATVLLSLKKDKEYRKVLPLLKEVA